LVEHFKEEDEIELKAANYEADLEEKVRENDEKEKQAKMISPVIRR